MFHVLHNTLHWQIEIRNVPKSVMHVEKQGKLSKEILLVKTRLKNSLTSLFFFIACERRRISGLQPKHNDDRKYVCVRRSSSPPPWSMGKHAVDWWALKAWHDNLQSQNRRQNYLRFFAQKSLSDVLLNSNGESNSSPPPPPPCTVVPLFELPGRYKKKNTLTFKWRGGGVDYFFSEVTQFEGNVSTLLILAAIVANLVVLMHCNF